jgi:hypothetical protein
MSSYRRQTLASLQDHTRRSSFPTRRIESDFSLSADELDLSLSPTPPRAVFYHRPEEEVAYGSAALL